MSFGTQLRQEIGQVRKGMNTTWKKSVVQAFSLTVQRTPVDKGVARNSWLIGSSNDGAVGDTRVVIDTFKIPDIGGMVLLYSNLPYIERLENGWSAQAPNGMVSVTVNVWPDIVRANS